MYATIILSPNRIYYTIKRKHIPRKKSNVISVQKRKFLHWLYRIFSHDFFFFTFFRLLSEAQKEKHMRNAHGMFSFDIFNICRLSLKNVNLIYYWNTFSETMSQQQHDYMLAHMDMACDQCDEMFESFSHAKRHYLSAHETKGYIKCCNKKMRTLLAIDDHIQWHKNPESLR